MRGYWAVAFRRRGKLHSKRFYDLKLGGSDKARDAAVAWRDQKIAATKTLSYREFHQKKRSNNTSGVPGVHFVKSARQPLGSWQAKLKLPDGRMPTKGFSVRKFGDRGAFERAVAARWQMLELVSDKPFLHSGTARQFEARRRAGRLNGKRR
jgi:hypothetical protein